MQDENSPAEGPRHERRLISAMLIAGLALLFVAGFIPLDSAHSIAHDVRHLLGFPCH